MTDRTTLDPHPALDLASQSFAVKETEEQTVKADETAVDELISFEPPQIDEADPANAADTLMETASGYGDDVVETAIPEIAEQSAEEVVLEPVLEDLILSEAWQQVAPETQENFEYADAIEEVEEATTQAAVSEPLSSYSTPRPALTLSEASAILGMSVRAIERSIQGKWGNKLPEGWQARKLRINGQEQWRIIPPQGFSLKRSNEIDHETRQKESRLRAAEERLENLKNHEAAAAKKPIASEADADESASGGLFGFSLEKLLQSAGRRAKDELVRAAEYVSEPSAIEHATIIIDRTDDVEKLLRELASARKDLADEQKAHLEDLRMLNQAQGSMRLLEMNASHTSTLRSELETTRQALIEHKRQYQEFLNLPWWKRLFKRLP